jgi:hypothetical protein
MVLFAVVPAAAGELFFGVILHLDIPYGTLIWLLIAGWNLYWFLLRFAYAVDLEDDVLRWRAPLRSGTLPIATLRRVRSSRIFSNVQIMEIGDGAPILVWAVKGVGQLMDALEAQRPGLDFHLSLQERLAERMPVRSSFRTGAADG